MNNIDHGYWTIEEWDEVKLFCQESSYFICAEGLWEVEGHSCKDVMSGTHKLSRHLQYSYSQHSPLLRYSTGWVRFLGFSWKENPDSFLSPPPFTLWKLTNSLSLHARFGESCTTQMQFCTGIIATLHSLMCLPHPILSRSVWHRKDVILNGNCDHPMKLGCLKGEGDTRLQRNSIKFLEEKFSSSKTLQFKNVGYCNISFAVVLLRFYVPNFRICWGPDDFYYILTCKTIEL